MKTFTVNEAASGRVIENVNDIVDSLREIGNADQESYWVVGCDKKRKEIFRECLFLGTADSVPADPRIIFRRLICSGAWSWAAVHNHPTGDPAPSRSDIEGAQNLAAGSKLLGLHLFDYLIIGEAGSFFSFTHEGLLPFKGSDDKGAKRQGARARSGHVHRNKETRNEDPDIHSALRRDWQRLKDGYPDAILFFDRGDFYETFFGDAEIASRILDIPLLKRGPYKNGPPLPCCAIPVHLRDDCIKSLLNHGHKVTICEEKPEGNERRRRS